MILFDTNVVIDALDSAQANHAWAVRQIEQAVVGEGGAINAITLAELCAGSPEPEEIQPEVKKIGLGIIDVPALASEICGRAYRRYIAARRRSGGGAPPKTPLPDFFIGAHAQVMGWKLATRDAERIALYFPRVERLSPENGFGRT